MVAHTPECHVNGGTSTTPCPGCTAPPDPNLAAIIRHRPLARP